VTSPSVQRDEERHQADGVSQQVGEATDAAALYPGDSGLLPEPARRALVQLLTGPSLDARRHSRLWPALLRYRELIESRLADLFLELILDADRQVAFTRQADTGELEAPILLRRSPLTFLDSALLLYLRQLLVEADTRGEPALVSLGDMQEQLGLFEPGDSTDRVGFDKRVRAAIEKAKKNSLIGAIRGSEGRFEISATLKLLFGAEEVATLTKIYENLSRETDDDAPTQTPVRDG
jgi:hypothetical protein